MGFTVSGTAPGAATLVSPTGPIATATPPYTWTAVASATYYRLYVTDSAQAGKVHAWLTPAAAGCASGTGPCSVTPAPSLVPGPATWCVQTWNPAGYGPWSAGDGIHGGAVSDLFSETRRGARTAGRRQRAAGGQRHGEGETRRQGRGAQEPQRRGGARFP